MHTVTNEAKNNASKRSANATANTIKMKTAEAKENQSFVDSVIENVTTATVEEVAEVNETVNTVETPNQEPTATVETVAEVIQTIETPAEEVKPVPTFQELRDKGKTLFMLGDKWEEVKGKQEQLRSFKLTHQHEQAKIVLSDAEGKTFASSNPKAIAKFIEFCSEQFENTLSELETEIRKIS